VTAAARPAATAAPPRSGRARRATQTAPAPSSGLVVFANECGICHTLAAAATTGRAGPNLDQLHPSVARVIAAIRNGGRGSGLMPRNALVGADVGLVARFVARSARR
jgi:mono/diheme cytochrome c family protein